MTFSDWAEKYGMLCCSEEELDVMIEYLIRKDRLESETNSNQI